VILVLPRMRRENVRLDGQVVHKKNTFRYLESMLHKSVG
jgi:hypothetical protein